MTLRNRVRIVIAVLAFSCIFVLGLLAYGGGLRGDSVQALSNELEADLQLVEFESCMQDLQRQMAYFGNTLPQVDASGSSGEGAEGSVPDLVEDQFDVSVHQSIAECRQRGQELEPFSHAARTPSLHRVIQESNLLLDDWAYVVEHVEHDYIGAVKRQAMSAQPRSEALFSTIFPSSRVKLQLRLSKARESFESTSREVDRIVLVCLLVGYSIVGITLFGLVARLTYGIQILTDGAIAFGRGDLDHTLNLEGDDEFQQISTEMNRMAGALSRSNGLLEQHAQQLEANLQTLKETQADLVRKQRMAALGGLVAGVAHEVNTPLGVAFTAGTFCHDRFLELQQESQLSDDTVQEVVEDIVEALSLMTENLSKAAHLVESFKQVAVDRGQAETRAVDLEAWLGSVLTSLSPLTKRSSVDVVWRATAGVRCMVAAGELEQVVSNLVVNAVVHAFPDEFRVSSDEAPLIDVEVELRGPTLWIRVSDNGRGMSPDELSKVFEPFFTTRRGAGGSGLGMHIVHQIVNERFEGSISTETSAGNGTVWAIQIPHPTDALAFIVG